MTVFRQTWFFAGAQGATWEEVWDVQADTYLKAEPPKPTAANPGIVGKRMACAHKTVTLQKITTRDLNDRSKPPSEKPYNVSGTAANAGGNPANTDEAAVILIGCSSGDGEVRSHRFLWMRGLEEEAVTRDATSGNPVLSADFRDNLNRFIDALRGEDDNPRRYGMLPRVRSSWEGPNFRFRITNVAGALNQDFCVLTLAENPGWVRGQTIQINGTNKKLLPGLRGLFTIEEVAGNLITVGYRVPQVAPPASGYAYAVVRPDFCFVTKSGSDFAYLGSRQSKKPVTGSRGRRSAVRLRR